MSVEKGTITKYCCRVCRTEYKTQEEASKCEQRTLEVKIFKIGDSVSNIPPRACRPFSNNYYHFVGKVIGIIGPKPADSDYENRWLRGFSSRTGTHVFEYKVSFSCPKCGHNEECLYYAPELKKV